MSFIYKCNVCSTESDLGIQPLPEWKSVIVAFSDDLTFDHRLNDQDMPNRFMQHPRRFGHICPKCMKKFDKSLFNKMSTSRTALYPLPGKKQKE